MDEAIQLFQSLTLSIRILVGFPESRVRELVTSRQIFGSEIWTMIGGLRILLLEGMIHLIHVKNDLWKISSASELGVTIRSTLTRF
jgi:hypothetical protein